MESNPRECAFCHDGLPVVDGEPVNMAFLHHIDGREDCREAFDVWTQHMAEDYIGY